MQNMLDCVHVLMFKAQVMTFVYELCNAIPLYSHLPLNLSQSAVLLLPTVYNNNALIINCMH
jgi:hypothetical protein